MTGRIGLLQSWVVELVAEGPQVSEMGTSLTR